MKYLVFRNIVFVFSLTVLCQSCKKDKVTTPEPTPKETKKNGVSKAWRVDSLQQVLEKKGVVVRSLKINTDSTQVSFDISRILKGAEEYGVYQPGVTNDMGTYPDHYIGKYLDGRSFLEDGKFITPGWTNGKSIAQDVQIVGGNGTVLQRGTLPELRNSDVKVWKSQVTNALGEARINENRGTTVVKIGKFAKYKDIKDQFLFNHSDIGAAFEPGYPKFDYKTDDEPIESRNGVFVFFRQDYYTMSIDSSKINWNVYKDVFHDSVYVKTDPVMMNSITYGRYGILAIDSWATTELMELLQKAMSDFTQLTDAEKKVLSRVDAARCFFFGLPEDWRYKAFVHKSPLEKIQLFAEIVKDNRYRFRPWGDAPTFYRLSTVRGNSPYNSRIKNEILTFDL